MSIRVDIVIPCYNPGEGWQQQITDFHTFIHSDYSVNYILVNDGSDQSHIQQQLQGLLQQHIPIRLISYPTNKGKGHALRTGVAQSNSEFIVYTDVDFPFTNASVKLLMDTLVSEQCDVVAGYRNELYYLKSMSGFRKILSKTFRWFIRRVLGMSVSDTQCGLKGFNAKGREKFLATGINRYLFDFEFIYSIARQKTLRVKTVEVQLKSGIVFSKMKLKILLQESFNLVYILFFRKN